MKTLKTLLVALAFVALLTSAVIPAQGAFPWKAGTDDPNVPNCYIGFSAANPGVECETPDFDWSIYCVTLTSVDNSTTPPTKRSNRHC